MTLPADSPQLDDLTLTDDARAVLVRAVRVAFPHERFPDGPYERTADKIVEAADASTWLRLLLVQGIGSLESLSGGTFRDMDADDATAILRHVEGTEFFGLLRRTAVLHLYDDPDSWDALGYEGPSFDKGGYVDRGFDDLDWLPTPRVEEYSGAEDIVEVAPDLARGGASGQVQPDSSDSNTTASHPGVAAQEAQDVSTKEAQ